jgi:hypothetical protein
MNVDDSRWLNPATVSLMVAGPAARIATSR